MKKLLACLFCLCIITGAAYAADKGKYEEETYTENGKTVTVRTYEDGSKEPITQTPRRVRWYDPSTYWDFGKPKFNSYGFGQNPVR